MADEPEFDNPLDTRLRLVKQNGELPPEDGILEPKLEPAGSEDDDDGLELISSFTAWNRGYQGGRDGEVYLTLTIPLENKYDAMKVTDEVGVVFQVAVFRKATRDEWAADG